jgi:hypothetical protein
LPHISPVFRWTSSASSPKRIASLTVADARVVRVLLVLGWACYLVGVVAIALPASSPGVGAV